VANTEVHKTNTAKESDRFRILTSREQSAGRVAANSAEASAIFLRIFSFPNVKYKTQAATISNVDCKQTVTYAAERESLGLA
jgi:hypothetical protein